MARPGSISRSGGTGRLPSSLARREGALARALFHPRVDYQLTSTTATHGMHRRG
jgi:hypothetical protein